MAIKIKNNIRKTGEFMFFSMLSFQKYSIVVIWPEGFSTIALPIKKSFDRIEIHKIYLIQRYPNQDRSICWRLTLNLKNIYKTLIVKIFINHIINKDNNIQRSCHISMCWSFFSLLWCQLNHVVDSQNSNCSLSSESDWVYFWQHRLQDSSS